MTDASISMQDAESICRGVNSKVFNNWGFDVEKPKVRTYDAGMVRFAISRNARMQIENEPWMNVKSCQIIWLSDFRWALEVHHANGITKIPIKSR